MGVVETHPGVEGEGGGGGGEVGEVGDGDDLWVSEG